MDSTIAALFFASYLLLESINRFRWSFFLFNEIILVFIKIDLGARWLLRKIIKPHYELGGYCSKCGFCCTQIIADPPRFIKRSLFLKKLFLAWHKTFHNFDQTGVGPNEEIIFTCRHLQVDGRCGNYRHRPILCRTYPLQPLFDLPPILPMCTHTIIPRATKTMKKRESLKIINPKVVIYHPTPENEDEITEHFHLVDISGGEPGDFSSPPRSAKSARSASPAVSLKKN
ncbi:YkgJ family cysteine cluster protein [Myxococcota bacterium]|nr:YkgJ family cysteine cluster protein [Myxococcota bacterium]